MNVMNINIQFGPGPQPQGPLTCPSWTVKRGWSIINLDKREYVLFPVPPREDDHPDNSWFIPPMPSPPNPDTISDGSRVSNFENAMWPLIDPVMLPEEEVIPEQQQASQSGGSVGIPKGIHALPLELKFLIFNAIENIRDATALCLTGTDLLCAGYKRVGELAKRKWASWSGDRILALPGRHDVTFWDGNIPARLQADSDLLADIEASGGFVPYLEGFKSLKCIRCPPSLREIKSDQKQFDWRKFGGVSLCHYPLDVPWVICNLSKHEYVCMPVVESTALFRYADPERQPSLWGRRSILIETIGRSIPHRICCSTGWMSSWAGDRIKACTLETAKAESKDWLEWKDVTSHLDPIHWFDQKIRRPQQ